MRHREAKGRSPGIPRCGVTSIWPSRSDWDTVLGLTPLEPCSWEPVLLVCQLPGLVPQVD